MAAGEEKTLYKYVDGDGVERVVDSLEKIPEKYRDVAKKIDDVKKKASEGYDEAKHIQHQIGDVVPFVNELHLPSLFVGFAGALFAFFLLTFLFKTGKLILKLALLAGAISLLAGGYLTWVKG